MTLLTTPATDHPHGDATPPDVPRPYRLQPIQAEAANRLRATGGVVRIVDEHPGFPCRQCLRDALVGEQVVLVSHDPFAAMPGGERAADSPYRCASPIYLHLADCGGPSATAGALPTQLTNRRLSVRCFDGDAMMTDAVVVDGSELDSVLRTMSAQPGTMWIHVHNAGPGCWAVAVEPGAPTDHD